MLINVNFQKIKELKTQNKIKRLLYRLYHKKKDNAFIFQIKYLYIKYLHKRIVKKYING